ncbi:cytokine receptor common subunit gamma-like [Pagrus major]|uniref:cytokine receptor common subunit gamma-like n=1 Tax=Pagrus major TaxID=143350 RepID=UPI003CC8B5B6
MPTRLLLLLCLTGHVFAKKPPDVDCLVVHMEYVHCSWNKRGTPEVNYTFYGWFENKNCRECTTYLSENGTITGCNHLYLNRNDRFSTFHTKLQHGNKVFEKRHELKEKVMLYPPTNLTVKMETDANLWFYWNQSYSGCVESEARYRINNKIWNSDPVSTGIQNYCINLPSNSSLYEVQVRSKFGKTCAESNIWSNWSEPVSWGNNNSTVKLPPKDGSMSVWTPVMYVLGALTLILMVMMLLHHERVRFILMPVPVPKPTFNFKEEWLQGSNCLKSESFYPNYNEHVCPVREYSPVSQSSSDSSDCSTSSITTDQTDCSVFIPLDGSDLSTSCSSSTSTVSVSSEEAEKVSV